MLSGTVENEEKKSSAAGKEQCAKMDTINTTPDDEEELPFEASTTHEGSVIEVLTESQDYDEDNWEENAKPPAKEDVLLMYHFQDGDAIDKAAQGLLLYEEKHCNASFPLQLQKKKCHPNRERLEPGKWLNDILIDFWMDNADGVTA